jgi:hypothetical protein
MRRFSLLVLSLAAGLLALVGAASTAQAAQPVAFTITETIDFENGDFDFVATGPLCPSGTFEDTVVAAGIAHHDPSKVDLLIRTVYTCADESGTFFALKHVFLEFTETGSTSTGPIQLLGGTGVYTTLSGHGVDNGVSTGPTGLGSISGFIVRI